MSKHVVPPEGGWKVSMTKEQVLAVLNLSAQLGVKPSSKNANAGFVDMRDWYALLPKLEAARAAIASWPEPGEAVATVCKTPEYYAHGNMITAELQVKFGTVIPRGTKLYAAPPSMSALLAELREVRNTLAAWDNEIQIPAERRVGYRVAMERLDVILSRYQE